MTHTVSSGLRIARAGIRRLAMVAAIGFLALTSAACSSHSSGGAQLITAELIAPPQGVFQFCVERQEECGLQSSEQTKDERAEKAAAEADPQLSDAELMDLARQVNASVNTAISYRTDYEQWGVEEAWLLPLSVEGVSYGDCEDYALEKRRALLALGVPEDRLSLATAWSEGTGLHAVLIVRTAQADYVLDNVTPHIVTVGATDYTWLSMQTGRHLLSWARVESPGVAFPTTQVMTAG